MIKEKIITSIHCPIKEWHHKETEAYLNLEKIRFPSGLYTTPTLEHIIYELLTNG